MRLILGHMSWEVNFEDPIIQAVEKIGETPYGTFLKKRSTKRSARADRSFGKGERCWEVGSLR
jgi:hypothetical protein